MAHTVGAGEHAERKKIVAFAVLLEMSGKKHSFYSQKDQGFSGT